MHVPALPAGRRQAGNSLHLFPAKKVEPKRRARQCPSTRPWVSLETPPRLRRFHLDSAAAEKTGPSPSPPSFDRLRTGRGAPATRGVFSFCDRCFFLHFLWAKESGSLLLRERKPSSAPILGCAARNGRAGFVGMRCQSKDLPYVM